MLLLLLLLCMFIGMGRSASACGDTGEGEEQIQKLYIYNTSTADNVLLRFPDLLFTPFFELEEEGNTVCKNEIEKNAKPNYPSFSLSQITQEFNYSCVVLSPTALNTYFKRPIIINMGQLSCNCTIAPLNNNSGNSSSDMYEEYSCDDDEYITSVYINIMANYTDGWIDNDWLYMGCSVTVNCSTYPLLVNDTFKQFVITQSIYTADEYAISYIIVVGLMLAGALVVVAITLISVRAKKDVFFNYI